jgi:homoserine kinase
MPQPLHIKVRVPASTSNLGPGFDALGLALELAVTVDVSLANETSISVSGEGEQVISCEPDNLVYQRMLALAGSLGLELPELRLHIDNDIPLERGLGASGAATLAGLLAANMLFGSKLSKEQILDIAYELEGHPDNVTPSLLGGCTVSAINDSHVTALQVPFPDDIVCALCIPDLRMPTHQARYIVPSTYPRADAVFNLSRTALFVTALVTGRYDMLRVAVQDRLHQAYRASLFVALIPMIEAACETGAYGAFLSGAGSTVAAFVNPRQAAAVVEAMAEVCTDYGHTCQTMIAPISRTGAQVSIQV